MNGHGQLKVWDVAEGRCSRTIAPNTVPTCVAILPDGRVLMEGPPNPHMMFMIFIDENRYSDLQGELLWVAKHTTGGVNAVAGLPNKRVVSASDDKRSKCGTSLGWFRLTGSIRV